jgi:hypothetical protein
VLIVGHDEEGWSAIGEGHQGGESSHISREASGSDTYVSVATSGIDR